MFDFTQLEAPPLDRILAALFHGKNPGEGRLILEIPGGSSVSYVIRAQSYKWSVCEDPPFYELGRLSPVTGRGGYSAVELEVIGVGP